jgi:hypothetical protein
LEGKLKMRNQYYTTFIIILAIIGSGCENKDDLMPDRFATEFSFVRYEGGREAKESVVKKGNELYDKVFNIISSQETEWKHDFTTYAPLNILHSEKMTINISGGLIIVNFNTTNNKWIQKTTEYDTKIFNPIIERQIKRSRAKKRVGQ